MVVADYDFHLFDLDGTLVDAEWSYTRGVFDRVGDRLGRPFSDREAYVLWHGLGEEPLAVGDEPVLDRLDLGDRFDAVVCCTDETGWKPDPDPIELAMADLGVDPRADRGYYAGDGESDVGAAWNAGLDAVHVERVGHEDRGRCVLGDRRVSRLDELLGPT
jgi:phosphoglycolate phosphatase